MKLKWSLLLLAVVALPQLSRSQSLADRWMTGLKAVDQDLRAQQWDAAAERSRKVAEQIVTTGGRDENVAYTLAVVSVFRALAEQGRGDADAAEWYSDVAVSLVPDIGKTDLKPYGALGAGIKERILKSHSPSQPLEAGTPVEAPSGNVTRPSIRHQVKPVYPAGLGQTGVTGLVTAETIIDVDGRLKHCRVLNVQGGGPAMKYAALDALREWRFEPARMEGKPVKVYYVLTINFRQRK